MVDDYVKNIFKYVKKVNMYDYNIYLREGCHHEHVKFTNIEHKTKKKVVKERRCDNPPRKIPYYRLRPIRFGH
jgi:hypothetical protein